MAEPLVDTDEDAFARAAAAGAALKRAMPAGRDAERARDAELMGQAGKLVAAARRIIDANRNGGSGHALAQPAGGEQSRGFTKNALLNWLRPALRVIDGALAQCDKRIVTLEALMKYQGAWNAEKVYSVGDFVTDGGSLWHCADTNMGARPGSSEAWRAR